MSLLLFSNVKLVDCI